MTADLILNACDIVGESLLWDDRQQRLVWIDIIGRRVHSLDPVSMVHRVWPMPFRPTSLALRADGGALLCSERHICTWDWEGAPVPLIEVEPDLPGNRLNEGAVGPDGALWLGSMRQNIGEDDGILEGGAASGRLYRYTPEGELTPMAPELYGITNTLVWPHEDLLVVGDTLQNTLYAYPVTGTGHLGPRRVFARGPERGLPDGSCTDAMGRVWNARVVGGQAVACFSPEGQLLALHDLPCLWPTSCAFGGAGMDRLFVTSARFTQSEAHLASHPWEGGIFALDGAGHGCPPHRFGQPRPTASIGISRLPARHG